MTLEKTSINKKRPLMYSEVFLIAHFRLYATLWQSSGNLHVRRHGMAMRKCNICLIIGVTPHAHQVSGGQYAD